ncbi:MAG TPA: trypsin-like peptidase domain-containing protein [Solirubrobacterales bacterium]|nr:trypsin-like peptidase domain-containing protein [Solirubrobacterales bacterium]
MVGLVAVEAGWVGDEDGSSAPTAAAAPLTEPVSDQNGGSGLTVNEIYERDSKGVAFIHAEQPTGAATGSGFVIDDDGHILTNAHVVENAEKIEVEFGDDGNTRTADLVGMDPSSDVALLHVDENDDLTPLQLGDSSKVEVGDPVVAIGNPFGLDRTVTTGIVSAKQRQIQAPNGFSISDVIQTDAAVNPGNSGGPLLDSTGRVIGINSQIASDSGGNDGVAFAVPIATAKDVADQLLADGSVSRAYLGVTGGEITSAVAEALNLSVDRGVVVEQAFEGGPAADAGIEGASGQATVQGQTVPVGGDIITKIDGKDVAGMEDVISTVNAAQPGDELTLTVIRDGNERDMTVTLGERPAQIEDAAAPTLP